MTENKCKHLSLLLLAGTLVKYIMFFSILGGVLLLGSCASIEEKPVQKKPSLSQRVQDNFKSKRAVDNIQDDQAITQALMPELKFAKEENVSFDVAAKRLNVKSFFYALVAQTQYNIVVAENLQGTVTLNLKDVKLPEVMRLIQEIYGYSIERIGRTYYVKNPELTTRVFEVNYVNLNRSGTSFIQVNTGQVGTDSDSSSVRSADDNSNDANDNNQQAASGQRGTQVKTEQTNQVWLELKATLEALVGNEKDRKIIVSPNTNLIVVRAMPNELANIEKFLQRAELGLQRQVILEAKILEISLDDGFQSGVNWQVLTDLNSGALLQVDTFSESLSDPNNINGLLRIFYQDTDFQTVIDLLSTQGEVKVLSSPRVSTVNNQKAVIKVGQDEFFVTDVSTTTVAGTATTTTPEVTLTPFFSGIALDVTPQISADNDVILHVHPAISEVEDQTKRLSVAGEELTLPLALNTIRETDSIVKAKNGQVIVIGGLMQNRIENIKQGIPVLGDLPFIGKLFSQHRETVRKSELVILIRPTIANSSNNQRLIDDMLQRAEDYELR